MKSNWKTVSPDIPTPIDKKIENQLIPTVFAEPALLGFHIRKWTRYKLRRINWDLDGQPFQYVAWFSSLTACIIGFFTIERVQLPESVPRICYYTIPVLSKNNSLWIFYFCWPDLHRTCNAVISSCEKAAKWCLRRHQFIAASFLFTSFAFEKWHRETNICINWSLSTYEVLEDTSVMYCMLRSVFLVDPAVSPTKGRSFAAFGRCNYTKSLISMNRSDIDWQNNHQMTSTYMNWRGHTRHRHTPICPWLKLAIYMCLFEYIWSHLFNSYSCLPDFVTLQLLTLVMYEYKVQKIGIKQHWKMDLLWFIACLHFWFEISFNMGWLSKARIHGRDCFQCSHQCMR